MEEGRDREDLEKEKERVEEETEKEKEQEEEMEEEVEVREGRHVRVLRWHPRREGEDEDGDGEEGEGRDRAVVFLVHGAGGRLRQWDNQIQLLKQHRVDIIAFDMLGHGNSSKPRHADAYTRDNLLLDFHEIVKRYRRPGAPNYIIAHSYGTALTMALMARLIEEEKENHSISGAVLVGSASAQPPGSAHPIWYLPEFMLELLRPMMAGGFVDKAWHSSTDRELVALEGSISAKNPMFVCIGCLTNCLTKYASQKPLFRGMVWPDETSVRKIDIPVLLLSGVTDGLTTAESARVLEGWLPKAKLHVLDDASHMVHMEQPQRVNELIREFLFQRDEAKSDEDADA